METVTDKFLRYVSFETTSDESSTTHPSNLLEVKLSEQLVKEMKAIGIADAAVDENGYVMGTIPSNIDRKVPVLGFIAHVDTSPDASGRDIKPQFIPNYDGTDIPLPGVPGLALRVADFPELLDYKGQTLITTDGTTLLGADDKAGKSSTEPSRSVSRPTRRSAVAWTSSTSKSSARTTPIRWTAALSANWSTRTSTRLPPRSTSRVATSIRAMPRERWSTPCTWPWNSTACCPPNSGRSIPAITRVSST